MHEICPLKLITTPVAILNRAGFTTKVGLSADDPLATRHEKETYRVFVTYYDPSGEFDERVEMAPLEPHERRLIDLGGPAQQRYGNVNSLAVVHRVPESLCPADADPSRTIPSPIGHSDFAMYRCMVQYGIDGGGHGGVIYETPPGLNATTRPSSNALSFTSKVAIGTDLDTTLLLIHHSVSEDYDRHASFRFTLFDSEGERRWEGERTLSPFSVVTESLGNLVGPRPAVAERKNRGLGTELFSLVGWSTSVALLVFCIQSDSANRAVSIEHAHPPQTYLLPANPSNRWLLKGDAISAWDAGFGKTAR